MIEGVLRLIRDSQTGEVTIRDDRPDQGDQYMFNYGVVWDGARYRLVIIDPMVRWRWTRTGIRISKRRSQNPGV